MKYIFFSLCLIISLLNQSYSSPTLNFYALCKEPCDQVFLSQFKSLPSDSDVEFIHLNLSQRENFDFAVSYEIGNFDIPGLLIIKDQGSKFLRTFETLKNKDAKEIGDIMREFLKKAQNKQTWFMLKGGNIFLMTRFFFLDYLLSNKMRAFVYFQGSLGILAILYGVCCQKSPKKKKD